MFLYLQCNLIGNCKIWEYKNVPASSPLRHSSCPAPLSALVPGAPPSDGSANSHLGQPQNETLQSLSPDAQTCDGEQIRIKNSEEHGRTGTILFARRLKYKKIIV